MEIPLLHEDCELRKLERSYEYKDGTTLFLGFLAPPRGSFKVPYWVALVSPDWEASHEVSVPDGLGGEFYPEVTERGWEFIWEEKESFSNE